MAARRITRKEMKRDEFITAIGRFTLWMEDHAREALIVGGVLVAAALGSVFFFQYLGEREVKASALLARGVEMLHATVRGAGDPAAPAGGLVYGSTDEKYRSVIDQMDALIQTYPRSQSGRLALYYKGLALTGLRKPQEAVKTLEEFLAASPDSFAAPMARAALARALDDAGEPQKAVDLYEQLAQDAKGVYPPQEALWEMGLCLERMGKKDEAKKVYERLTRDFPDSDYSQEAQGRLKSLS
ncbi:MAG TPA: tetratricopeptide repeat protein [Candidatus Polarisedimenticolia bacterium]|jgi:tetratricopeptide (TPR) repeat protein|nr:tetratricopeptide repeat protein [Candidatus Polarisedimenticolia bacterium]